LRDKYHKLVDDVFNAHENSLREHIRSQYKIDLPDTTKLKTAIEEMEQILIKLAHTSTTIPAIKKSMLLDHQALINYFSHLKNQEKKNLIENYVT